MPGLAAVFCVMGLVYAAQGWWLYRNAKPGTGGRYPWLALAASAIGCFGLAAYFLVK